MLSLDYTAPGKQLAQFIASDAEVSSLMGPFGSGKSTGAVIKILKKSVEQKPAPNGRRHTRWAIVRNSFPELKTTTIKTWHQWVPASVGAWRSAGPPTHHIVDEHLDMEVMFLALDDEEDVRKLLSLELTGAWLNEVREIPKAILDGLTGRIGRYPSGLMGGCTWRGILMDTNPPEVGSWYYNMAEEEDRQVAGWKFFRQPSGLAPDAENLDWLEQTEDTLKLPLGNKLRRAQGRKYYERIAAGKDEDWVKVFVHGDYGFTVDGKPVYPEYRDSQHCREFEINPKLPIEIGIDFGLTPAAALGQRTVLGQWKIFDELVTEDMGAVRFAELLGAMLRGKYGGLTIGSITGDPAGDTRAQTDERTPFEILNGRGIKAKPAHTNDWTVRREAVGGSLSRLIDGQPGLILHPRCVMLRKAMAGGYCLRRLHVAGQDRYRDVPDKTIYSHVAEANQYLLLGGGEGLRVLRGNRPAATRRAQVPTYDLLA